MDHISASPSYLKAKMLTQKLVNLQTGLQNQKQARQKHAQNKLKLLQQKIKKQQMDTFSKIQLLREACSRAAQAISTQRYSRQILDDKKTKEIQLAEQNLVMEIQVQKQTGNQHFLKLEKQSQEKLFDLRLELNKTKKQREDSQGTQLDSFTQQISKLSEIVEEEAQNRENSYEKLVRNIGQKLEQQFEKVDQAVKEREDMHAEYYKMIQEMEIRVKQELLRERKERESVEDTLINLLDETCQRVEISFQSRYQF